MQRHQLEHIIHASAGITGAPEFIIVGSQAVLGQFPRAPAELLVSMEADVFSLNDPSASDLIDATPLDSDSVVSAIVLASSASGATRL